MNRIGAFLANRVAVLAAIAIVLAVLAPAPGLAPRADLLLATLVLVTAVQLEPARLQRAR